MLDRRQGLLLGGAVLATIASVICVFAGWAGVRDEPSVAAQIPYLVTGAGFGIVFMVAAAGLASAFHRELVYQLLREDIAVLQDQIDEMAGRTAAPAQPYDEPQVDRPVTRATRRPARAAV
jgi:hypothetical protein